MHALPTLGITPAGIHTQIPLEWWCSLLHWIPSALGSANRSSEKTWHMYVRCGYMVIFYKRSLLQSNGALPTIVWLLCLHSWLLSLPLASTNCS